MTKEEEIFTAGNIEVVKEMKCNHNTLHVPAVNNIQIFILA